MQIKFSVAILSSATSGSLNQSPQSFVRGEYLSEAPDFVKRVVEWSGGDADDVRFAEVAFHSGGDQLVVQLLGMFVRQDGQLTTAIVGRFGSNHCKSFRGVLVQQKLEITRKASGFRAQRLHRTRFVESLKRSAQRRHGKNRRVTDLPAIS